MHGNPRVGDNLPTAGDRLLRVVSDCLGTDCILVLGDWGIPRALETGRLPDVYGFLVHARMDYLGKCERQSKPVTSDAWRAAVS